MIHVSPPGDGGQQGRAHSRQFINSIFSRFSHSGMLSTNLSLDHGASFRSSPASVSFSRWSYGTSKWKHDLLARARAGRSVFLKKIRVGGHQNHVGLV